MYILNREKNRRAYQQHIVVCLSNHDAKQGVGQTVNTQEKLNHNSQKSFSSG